MSSANVSPMCGFLIVLNLGEGQFIVISWVMLLMPDILNLWKFVCNLKQKMGGNEVGEIRDGKGFIKINQ